LKKRFAHSCLKMTSLLVSCPDTNFSLLGKKTVGAMNCPYGCLASNTRKPLREHQTGETPLGAPILRQRSFPNVKSSATDQDIYDVASAIYGLQDYSLIGVRRDNRFDLIEA